MTSVQSQAILSFPAMPGAVTMDIDCTELEQEASCHGNSNSFTCRTAHLTTTGVCRAELEEVSHHTLQEEEEEEDEEEGEEDEEEGEEEVGMDSLEQLQDSTSAATGERNTEEGGAAGCMEKAQEWLLQEKQAGITDSYRPGEENEDDLEAAALASEAAEGGGNGGELPFSKQLISFSLFGKLPSKSKRPWSEALSARIAEVKNEYKNIPQMLYFSPSSISLDGIGVYAADKLPKDTLLGPYLGKTTRKEMIQDEDNQWLWEIHEEDSFSYCIDARDPKYGNWMNYIQAARHTMEQNLRVAQYSTNLYFVVTRDIEVGEELLVWYDQDQYHLYMGVPTGFHPVTPPSLFIEHQQQQQQEQELQRSQQEPLQQPQQQALQSPQQQDLQHALNNTEPSVPVVNRCVHTSHASSSTSSSSSSSPRHPSLCSTGGILAPPPPTYPSCHGNASVTGFHGKRVGSTRGGSYSDGASTDDSGINMDTNSGPTPPLAPPTFDIMTSRHAEACKDMPLLTGSAPMMPASGSLIPTHSVLPGSGPVMPGSGPVMPGSGPIVPAPGPIMARSGPVLPGSDAPAIASTTDLQVIPSSRLLTGTLDFPSPPEGRIGAGSSGGGGLHYAGGLVECVTTPPEGGLSWGLGLGNTVHTITSSSTEPQLVKLVPSTPVSDQGLIGTGMETPPVWGTGPQHYVDSPPGAGEMGAMLQGPLNKKQLLYGMFQRSEDGSRWHCVECKRIFSSQGSLRAHARIHTGERPYQCQFCFRSFCQASTLRSHERLHTGEKPYKCEECGRAFTQSAGLRSHRKTHRYDS